MRVHSYVIYMFAMILYYFRRMLANVIGACTTFG